MKNHHVHLIKKSEINYRVKPSVQTGFASPATHYTEPRIDLNETLVTNQSATFYVRVVSNVFVECGINENDVLIVDKSLTPKNNQLVVVISEESFKVVKFNQSSKTEVILWGVITYIIKSKL